MNALPMNTEILLRSMKEDPQHCQLAIDEEKHIWRLVYRGLGDWVALQVTPRVAEDISHMIDEGGLILGSKVGAPFRCVLIKTEAGFEEVCEFRPIMGRVLEFPR